MLDLDTMEKIFKIVEAVATSILVFLLWFTVKQMKHTVALHQIQTEYRFRPWLGPFNSIKYLSMTEDRKHKFDVSIKNYGELPSTDVVAMLKIGTKVFNRADAKSNLAHSFNLGPILPNMEKHYWILIDDDLIQKAKNQNEKIFTSLYFEYQFSSTKSGYGMISQYDPATNGFIHLDMWVDTNNQTTNIKT